MQNLLSTEKFFFTIWKKKFNFEMDEQSELNYYYLKSGFRLACCKNIIILYYFESLNI